MSDWLLPFSYSYMVNAMGVGALIGVVCALMSCFLVQKGWSLMGDALSHAVVPGVAGAYLLGVPYVVGAFLTGVLAALAIVGVKQHSRLPEDACTGLVFTGFFALGLFMISVSPVPINVRSIIYGNLLAIDPSDTWQLLAIAAVVISFIGFRWRALMLVFFDERGAWAVGINPTRLKVIFFAMLSASVVAGMVAVGGLLVVAMVITPGATAFLLTDRFGKMLLLSALIGALSVAFGVYVSFFIDGATGGVVVCLQCGLFLLAYGFAPKYGQLNLWRLRRQTDA